MVHERKYNMIIHPIHDLNNNYAVRVLYAAMSAIDDQRTLQNYHPDFASMPGNLFYIIREGRFKLNSGTYYVAEEDGKFISSAGWNDYQFEWRTALLLTRMIVAPEFRGKFTVGRHILPIALGESIIYHDRLWMTFGETNRRYLKWFDPKRHHLIPPLYRKFSYVGQKQIYYTTQNVVEYKRNP